MKHKLFHTLLIAAVTLTLTANCKSNGSDDQSEQTTMTALLLGLDPAATGFQCSASITFAEFVTEIQNDSCTTCHGATPSGGAPFSITDYTQTLARVTPNDSANSLLYQKVNGGSMEAYATNLANTRAAIQCWIDNGANP